MSDDGAEHQSSHLERVECIVCKTASSISRALPKSQASQYGLKEEDVPSDARVCNLCRCKALRSRFTNCPVSSCPNAKMQRVKRLRSLPIKWVDLIPSVREQLQAEFGMDETLTKCCSLCYNRIVRKISASMDVSSFMTSKGKMNQARCSILNWSDEEIQRLKDGLKHNGINWSQVADVVGGVKTPQQCMTFFYKYMKKLNLEHHLPPDVKEAVLEERKPALTDEEESGSSTSSCDEIEGRVDGGADSDTASAPSPLQNSGSLEEESKENSITTPPPQLIEEGRITIPNPDTPERGGSASSPQSKGSTSGSNSLLPPVLLPNKEDYDSSATETADEGQGGGDTESGLNQAPTPKRDEEPSSPLTVKDLMLNVIEMQLMKNPQGNNSTNPGGPPTISSILKSDNSISYNQRERNTSRPNPDNSSLATVSVVNTQHSHQPPVQDLRKEGLVVVQVPQNLREAREPEGVTLDLSIKRPREAHPQMNKPVSHHLSPQPSSHGVYRVSHQSQQQPLAQMQQVQQQSHQSHSQPQQHHTQQPSGDSSGFFHQQILPPPLAPKLSPGVITGAPPNKPQCGSIIHGTPVSSPNLYNQGRYEQQGSTPIILHTSPHKEPGSITQGTPVHQRSSLFPSNPSDALFNKRMAPQGFYPPRVPAFNVEQRQIIMNDYITSREMPAPTSSSSRNGREKMYYPSGARQGVIQRHNTKPPSPGVSHHPPGYEAFSSLVDVASRQPSLPVPSPMTMSMPEVKNMPEDKRHLHGEGLGERFNRDSPHDRFPSRESEMRYMKESSKVHSQPSDRREHQQQSSAMLQLREQIPHGRETYQSHHMEREMQAHQMNIREQQQRDREHHNHQAHKAMREHQIHVQQQQHQQQQHQQQQQQQHQQQQHQQQQQQQRDLELRGVPRAIQNYPQRIIHNDPHMGMDQRLIQVQIYREQPSSSQSSSASSSAHAVSRALKQQEQQSVESQNVRGRPSEASTLTAASLIDAIITHQINQSSEGQSSSLPSGAGGGPQTQHTRPGDRLFQSFHRECSESNGKVSPMKSNLSVENKGQHSSQPPVHGSEHMEVYGSQPQGLRSSIYQGYEPQTWKLRRALQSKDVETPMHEKPEEHVNRGYYADPPVPLSPLDYVKNRIAEVMRTSEEDGAGKGNDSPISPDVNDDMESSPVVSSSPYISQNPHAYTYPYSALSLTTGSGAGVSMAPQTVNKPGNDPIPEPAPLLSAQYEPLSDED
ncbi:hypothetical protein GE061_000168 [Apolygus lucorum]|uniref:SANT domain-containing protein n=1 Tax=Apolygus lucorum TaxID=248454 RepID=A0A8S9Y3U4_APOLU|nr:hypothetical protein GE061_000168 [Apolygus lucorum]